MSSSADRAGGSKPVSSDQVEELARRSAAASERFEGLEREAVRLRMRLKAFDSQLRRANMTRRWVVPLRRFFTGTTTLPGGVVLMVVVAAGAGLLLSSVLGAPWLVRIIAAAGGGLLSAFAGWVLFTKSDEALEAECVRLAGEREQAARDLRGAENAAASASQAQEAAARAFDDIRRAFESRLNQLRSMPWEGFTGIQFEQFLVAIFAEWGYQVETTKTTGDQGVDLVVSKGGRRIAIQAKGYPGTTVGNGAVQEAHAGKAFYGCDTSAVITNSRFSSGAAALAAKVDCHLIDAAGIRELLDGRFPF